MTHRFILTCAAMTALFTGPASAQLMQPFPAPSRTEQRQFEWIEIFPSTPNFTQWQVLGTWMGNEETGPGKVWLHGDSLIWIESGILGADVLAYEAGVGTTRSRYVRARIEIDCKFRRFFAQALADVIIDPDGNILPVSKVVEGGTDYLAQDMITGFDQICIDAEVRSRFMAGN